MYAKARIWPVSSNFAPKHRKALQIGDQSPLFWSPVELKSEYSQQAISELPQASGLKRG